MTTLLALLALAPAPLVPGKTVDLPKAGGFDCLAFDADRHRLLAAHSGAGTLAVLDVATGKAIEIPTGSINGVAVSKRLDRYFVAGGDKELVEIDRKSLEVTRRVPLAGPGDIVAMDTRRNRVLVGHDDGTELWAFDGATLRLVGTVAIEEAPEFTEYDAASDRIYQNIKSTDHLQVIDPATNRVVATWPTGEMKSPHGLVLDPKARRAYAAGRNGKLAVIDLATGRIVKTLDVATGVDQIAIDPGLGRVYLPGGGRMTVVSTASGAVRGEVALPKGARHVAVDPTTHTVWIAVSDERGARFASFRAVR